MARAARQLNLSGVFAASVTPNRPGSLEADYPGILELLDFLAAGGVTGVCMMGSTGEFVNYFFEDRQRAVYLGSKRTRVPLIVGVAHSTLSGALRLADEAVQAGADGLLLMPPYFFPYQQAEVEAFYREFAAEAGSVVPVMLYNIPQFTTGISIETARRLLESGQYAGIKDSSGDWGYFEELLSLRRQRNFTLFVGNDRIAARALACGADGVLSGCACAVPELLVALVKAVTAGDEVRAGILNDALTQFVDQIEAFPTPTGIKRAVSIRGQKSGDLAAPLCQETAEALDRFGVWFKAWWPDVAKLCAAASVRY